MTPVAARAARLVELMATVEPRRGHVLDAIFVGAARKIAADLRRERDGTSRSGIPLTRRPQ